MGEFGDLTGMEAYGLSSTEVTSEILAGEGLRNTLNVSDAGNRTADATDQVAVSDGGFRHIPAGFDRLCSDYESTLFAATLIGISQNQVETRLSSIQAV